MPILSANPATGEPLKKFSGHSANEIEHRVQQAEATFQHHRHCSFAERSQLMMAAATILDSERQQFAEIISSEMGKIIGAARDEVEKCSLSCRFYAQNAERFLEEQTRQTKAARSFVRYEPMGVILAI